MKRQFHLCVVMILAMQLASCIGIRAHDIPVVDNALINTENASSSKVYSEWKYHSDVNQTFSEKTRKRMALNTQKLFNKVIEESHCCVIVDTKKEADVVVEAIVHDDNDVNHASAALTGATFYVIPSIQDIIGHISATVHKDGKSYHYDYVDSMKMVQWLPLIVAAPFMNPFSAAASLDKNLQKSLVLDMKKDGLIQ